MECSFQGNEFRDGDKNTQYFHHKASQCKKQNTIHGLLDENGVWKKGKQCYFSKLFSSDNQSEMEEALTGLACCVTTEMNTSLTILPSGEEVREVIFAMLPNKAPGIDGSHALFFQKFWHMLGVEVISFIQSWWGVEGGGIYLSVLNKTCIVLIPKRANPRSMKDFNLIILCNVLYKILSKTLGNRLKFILPAIISQNQKAFVPRQLITDNALVAVEIFHAMEREISNREGLCALKLDMSKA